MEPIKYNTPLTEKMIDKAIKELQDRPGNKYVLYTWSEEFMESIDNKLREYCKQYNKKF